MAFLQALLFFPSDSIGIIVLSNQNASSIPGIVRNMIADRVLGIAPFDWNGRANAGQEKAKQATKDAEKSMVSNRKTGTSPSHPKKDYAGLYSHPGYGTIEVALRNDSLIMVTQNGDAWLRHYHYDVFELMDIDKEYGIDTSAKGGLKIQYQMNPAGEISSITLPVQPGLKDLEFERKAKAKEMTKSELTKYIGEYELGPGAVAKFYIKGENTLYAFIEGQPEYELIATGKNKFDLKVLKGYSALFEENEKGDITAVSFVQPNGTFKAKKIK